MVKKHSPLFVALLVLALLTPLGASSMTQQGLPAPAASAAAPSAPVTTPTVVIEGTAAGDALGSSVDNAGDINGDGYDDLIAGAPLADVPSGEATLADAGEAMIYYGSATGLSATADLTLTSGAEGDHFGHDVAGIGDVNGDGFDDVAVSAPFAGAGDEGLVQIFLGSATGLSATPSFSVAGQAGSEFGYSIDGGDVNGDGFADLIVGAPLWDAGETDEGVVWVFYGGAGGVTTTGSTMLQMNQADAHFGHSVAFAGDTDAGGFGDVLVGAPMWDGGQMDEGAAFLFEGAAGGVAMTPSWTFECDEAGAMCGESVAGNGDIDNDGDMDIAVGAPGYAGGVGRVFTFSSLAGTAPTLTGITDPAEVPNANVYNFAGDAEFSVPTTFPGGTFGPGGEVRITGSSWGTWNPDVDGIHIVFASSGVYDIYFTEPQSAVGVVAQPNQFETYNITIEAFDAADNSLGSFTRAISGNAGAAFLGVESTQNNITHVRITSEPAAGGFAFTDLTWGSDPTLAPAFVTDFVQGTEAGAEFGSAVAFLGDTNGDGFDDLLVGAPMDDTGGADAGSAFLYYGGATGLAATPAWQANGTTGDMFGADVTGGDFDGDTLTDLAIGAPGFDGAAGADSGAVFIYAGQPDVRTPVIPEVCRAGTATPHPTSSFPSPASGVFERQIENCYDDAHERTDTKVVYPLLDTITTGGTADGARYSGGFLFRNVEIPEGSRVISATLQLYAIYQSGTPIDLRISGDASGMAEDFQGAAGNISARPRTSSAVSFTLTSRVFGWVNTPDVTSIVQELLGRDDWMAGNNMAFIIDPAPEETSYATWAAFERSPELAARLLIQYEPAATPTPTATMTATVTNTPTVTETPSVTVTPTVTTTPAGFKVYLPIVMR